MGNTRGTGSHGAAEVEVPNKRPLRFYRSPRLALARAHSSAVVVAVVTFVAAVLGGLASMHYHLKVDHAGFTPTDEYDAG